MPTPCFMIHPTTRAWAALRRYSQAGGPGTCPGMPGEWSYHNGETPVGVRRLRVQKDGTHNGSFRAPRRSDPRWPLRCTRPGCRYRFTVKDHWQAHLEQIWEDDKGKEYSLRDLPAGAMYYADWYPDKRAWRGPDGRCLCVQTPGGLWMVDGRASNCTLPNDSRHKCWCRHGVPPKVTVDKDCNTCQAGAGSIQSGSYHGFLQNGVLT